MSKRLWDKGKELDKEVHLFTVGDDPVIDLELVKWDILASFAHAEALNRCGVLKAFELKKIKSALHQLLKANEKGNFVITPDLEDCHTAIENSLIKELGELGKKIHTGRSRNDQVLTAVRLFLKDSLINLALDVSQLADSFLLAAGKYHDIPMPGYTHFQSAMPTTVGTWLAAFAEHFLDEVRHAKGVYEQIDFSPLGVGSGFGVPFDLSREKTAKRLGFSQAQRNPIHVQNRRGREELILLRWISDIASDIEKFAFDVVLFAGSAYRFINLPEELTTGSSIMPQKRNPDVAELLRASCGKIRGAEDELRWIIAKLPSSYHRDFQFTKGPVIRAVREIRTLVSITSRVVASIKPNVSALRAAMTPDLYATHRAYSLVKSGVPFRDAYKQVGLELDKKGLDVSEREMEEATISIEVDLKGARKENKASRSWLITSQAKLKKVEKMLGL